MLVQHLWHTSGNLLHRRVKPYDEQSAKVQKLMSCFGIVFLLTRESALIHHQPKACSVDLQ